MINESTGAPPALRVLVVGGRSRSASAFRRFAARNGLTGLIVLVRQSSEALPGETQIVVDDYFDPPAELLQNVDAVVNFAGIPETRSEDILQAINVRGPERLAKKACNHGVKHFLQISSTHIYGAPERIDRTTPEAPQSPYARSKQAADRALSQLMSDDFKVTLLRMPMHYGPKAGDKLRKLARLIRRLGWFAVPRAPVRRSMVHQDNLAAAILTELHDRRGGIQFAADPDLFGYEILCAALREHTQTRVRLLRFPDFVFIPLRYLAGGIYQRLYRDNVIAPEVVIQPHRGYPVRMMAGLKDVVRERVD